MKMITAVADVFNIVRRCFVSLVCVKPLCYWSLGFFHSSSWKTFPYTWCSLIVSVKRDEEMKRKHLERNKVSASHLCNLCAVM